MQSLHHRLIIPALFGLALLCTIPLAQAHLSIHGRVVLDDFTIPASLVIDFSPFDRYVHRHHTRPDFYWKYTDGRIPRGAFAGGFEKGHPLYICQSYYHGGVHPGKYVDRRCNITYGGREIPQNNFRILVGKGLFWRTTRRGRVPANAIPGGYENGHPLYICHATYAGGIHPGKIVGRRCDIGYGGREIQKRRYQVLVG